MSEEPISLSAQLNRDCLAPSLDRGAFRARLDEETGVRGLYRRLLLRQPGLFAEVPVFLERSELDRIHALVRAAELVAALEPFQREALCDAPPIARRRFGPRGVFFGYDFHLGAGGPQLIEINTNAGGAFLSSLLARSQRAPCDLIGQREIGGADASRLDLTFVAMFREEWKSQRGDAPLRTIAIVDERPDEQMLYADFLLCQGVLRRAGYDARVIAPEALVERDGALFDGETEIDLVYNRLTDFYLESEPSGALRRAYLAGGVVVTPHPYAHALYADKRRLALLSDGAWLAKQGVAIEVIEALLTGVPTTEVLDASSRERLFRERSSLFFKPRSGFGSQAVHRGDELSATTWEELRDGEHVAQRLVPPSERTIALEGEPVTLKLDVRAYAYAGEVDLVIARLYQGPATNLRTVGGGFAPIYVDRGAGGERPSTCSEACGRGRE